MASTSALRHGLRTAQGTGYSARRWLGTSPALSSSAAPATSSEPLTHYRITQRRSAISLGERIKGTLASLGLHRRMQTVFHPHTPETAGKILAVKELVEVANVPASEVRDKTEQRRERRSPRGYTVVKRRVETVVA